MGLKIVFVHGTGVREPDYSATLKVIEARLKDSQPTIHVGSCYWGGNCGSAPPELSLPAEDAHRALVGAADVTDAEALVALWALLYEDPLFELRLAGLTGGNASAFGVDTSIIDRLQGPLESDPEAAPLVALLAETGRRAAFNAAAVWLAGQGDFREILAGAQVPRELAEPAARAVVARMILAKPDTDGGDFLAVNPPARDRLAEGIAFYLAGSQRGLFGSVFQRVAKPIKGLAVRYGLNPLARLATNYAANRRATWMDHASPAAGDILVYQARGEKVRDFIRNVVRGGDRVVLLAHSLGGIACVDLLIKEPEPKVELLITAGSQSPYFYEIGALQTLPFESQPPAGRLPEHFPPWLNLYDRRDFLSFVGQPLFGPRVTDERVDNQLAFPQSHSGYWHNPAVWQHIGQALSRLKP